MPDLRRRAAVGAGGAGTTVLGAAVGATGGAETHRLAVAELASHDHTDGSLAAASAGSHDHQLVIEAAVGRVQDGLDTMSGRTTDTQAAEPGRTKSAGAHTHSVRGRTTSVGGGAAHPTLPPSAVVAWLVRV